ncbi:MBL fold metallo-hydrolase [Oceanobacillus salinisoli]|uniref:MBL fold metallo-hydrolase n=1 Tax=Oceanobacillus salinisoli TaxID=2678611 RepID=UPI0012E2535D|nr:MBL fold metallo-hydrolase [Oceanobacillus salinisoli]
MDVIGLSVGPLGTNCYIVLNGKDALIIDPGGDANQIIEVLNAQNASPKAILLTHAHFDHIGAVEELRSYFNIEVYLHDNEKDWLGDAALNRSLAFIGNPVQTAHAEHDLKEGDLTVASFTFEVIHTPGHSPGSVSFIFHNENWLFGGDVLFREGIGRTDLPGGDMEQLEASIRQKFYTLNDAYIVYPGHGPKTTIENEKRNNPFIRD